MTTYSDMLRHWRKARRLSQLDLALEASVSARHISFLETGRARPSRDMVLHLGDALDVPLHARNAMLGAVGFAPWYRARDWEDAAMAPIRKAIDWMLDRHAPYPGIAIDRLWRIERMNAPAARLFGAIGAAQGVSLLDLIRTPAVQAMIENWPEVAHHSVQRLRHESTACGGVPELEDAITDLAPHAAQSDAEPTPAIPTIFRMGDLRLALFGTIAQFGTSADQTIEDLKIELFFPADDTAEAFLRADDSYR